MEIISSIIDVVKEDGVYTGIVLIENPKLNIVENYSFDYDVEFSYVGLEKREYPFFTANIISEKSEYIMDNYIIISGEIVEYCKYLL